MRCDVCDVKAMLMSGRREERDKRGEDREGRGPTRFISTRVGLGWADDRDNIK